MSQKIEFGDLTVEISENSDQVLYKFDGDVNEHFRHQNLPLVEKTRIIFDLEHVSSFNSCGIREWINLVSSITQKGKVEFEKCSIVTIDQINMVPDVAKNVQISSFYAPYFCENDDEMSCLIETTKEFSYLDQGLAPVKNCDVCKEELEFDAIEESYFLFIRSHKSFPAAS